MIRSTSPAELKEWLSAGDAILVDVREESEYAQGRIKGSLLIPLNTVNAEALPSYAGKKLVMQCRSGARSRTACGLLSREIADLEVYNLEGGILAWQQAGFPVET